MTVEGNAFVTKQPGCHREISVSMCLNAGTAWGTALPPTSNKPGLEHFKGRGSHSLLRNLCQGYTTLIMKVRTWLWLRIKPEGGSHPAGEGPWEQQSSF